MDNLHSGPRFIQSRIFRVEEASPGFIPRVKWLVDFLPHSRGFRMDGLSITAHDALIPPAQQPPLAVCASFEADRTYQQASLVFKCLSEGGVHVLNLCLLAMRKTPDAENPEFSLKEWCQVPSDYRAWALDALHDHQISFLNGKVREAQPSGEASGAQPSG
ncbi:hypothetical protein H101_07817, partial [Trichophyton interdigitale H6]